MSLARSRWSRSQRHGLPVTWCLPAQGAAVASPVPQAAAAVTVSEGRRKPSRLGRPPSHLVTTLMMKAAVNSEACQTCDRTRGGGTWSQANAETNMLMFTVL